MIGTFDLITKLRKMDGSFKAREQQVSTYVLENLETISQTSVSNLAKACDVSEPTVIRFCRKLGCEGFKDFKIQLAQNVAVSLQYLSRSESPNPKTDSTIDQVLSALISTTNVAHNQINPEQIANAVEAITKAQTLIFCGVGGGSTTVAFDAANRFFRLGITSLSLNDAYLLRMHAATLGPNDLMFFISSTGTPRALIDTAKIANQYGATTVCLTRPNSELSQTCSLTIGIDLPEDPDIYKPTASRLVFLAIIDILAASVARQMPDKTKETLRRIRASLTALHGNTDPQPIGD
ncbi:MurR/RpiR family transcriptional regulator [Kiloniella sp.]|uniref:MurR/RpiR family transcriptional regulator n=1 Tax=Kiloniella sp. TaxID=1938587 RepID=UPI003B02719C